MDNFNRISIEEEEELNELMELINFSVTLLELIAIEGFTEISFVNSKSRKVRTATFISKS